MDPQQQFLPIHQILRAHCDSCQKTFLVKQQIKCPNCNWKIEQFVNIDSQIQKPETKSLVITVSTGFYLHPLLYTEQDILHVGITDSNSQVFNFWNTYKIENSQLPIWRNCLNVKLDKQNQITDEIWDMYLNSHMNQLKNDPKTNKYHDLDNNCFDYIVSFLNEIQFNKQNKWDKNSLAERLIAEPITKFENFCSRYVNFYEKNKQNELYYKEVVLQYSCDVCKQKIKPNEKKYKCLVCKEFDVCQSCFEKKNHEHECTENDEI